VRQVPKKLFSPRSLTGGLQSTESEHVDLTIAPPPRPQVLGGYDGGVLVGFYGTWNPTLFSSLFSQLETARDSSENEKNNQYITLENWQFLVYPHGANDGAHYKYVIEGQGIKIYIHSNPKGGIQPIRVRYGFEALVGRDLFQVHFALLDFLKSIGFMIEKETLSRVDLQCLFLRPVEDFLMPVLEGKCVKRAQKMDLRMRGSRMETLTLGHQVQLCIYDKLQELATSRDEIKLRLLVEECLGGEVPDHLTRVEFRLRREALKDFGIDTMTALLAKEHAIVEYLTFDWFRLLESRKVRGHENTQKLSDVWQETIARFKEYFPSMEGYRKPLETRDKNALRCTGKDLIHQAVGCLATMAARAKGVFENEVAAFNYCVDVLREYTGKLFVRSAERVKELNVLIHGTVPDVLDWCTDPRYASSSDSLESYRELWDEDLQYERFRNFAVEGCPF
jgi:hypothetical protein